jgi:hypothetical protein
VDAPPAKEGSNLKSYPFRRRVSVKLIPLPPARSAYPRRGYPHRRNLTPDQLALVMGRHYNRTKKQGGQAWSAGKPLPQNVEGSGSTSDRLRNVLLIL